MPSDTKEIIERNKSSVTVTLRKRKQEEGDYAMEVTGIDIKVYGDSPEEMEKAYVETRKRFDKQLSSPQAIVRVKENESDDSYFGGKK